MNRAQLIELYELEEEREKRRCERSYYEFFKSSWHVLNSKRPLVDAPYIKYLCDKLQYYVEQIINDEPLDIDLLIINIPPGQSKSSIVTKHLLPWIWIKDPSMKFCNSSYSQRISYSHNGKSRDIITSEWYQSKWGDKFRLKSDVNTKSLFENNYGGARMATSTGGAVTGFHFDIFVQDDPLNPVQTASEASLQKAIDFNDETVPSRIEDNGLRIIVMQRLHEDDPTGHELDREDDDVIIEHVCLPAQVSDDVSPTGASKLYDDDGYLTPRLDKRKLDQKRKSLGPYAFAGQYDQSPTPKGGGSLKTDWFQHIHEKELPADLTWHMLIDGAYTEKTKNDPTGILIFAKDNSTQTLYFRMFVERYMEMPELIEEVNELAEIFGLGNKSKVFVEQKASGLTLIQLLNNQTILSAIKIESHLVAEGKVGRHQCSIPKYAAFKVVHVSGNWNKEFEHQLSSFPRAKKDEAVDLAGYACDLAFKVPKRRRRRSSS